MTSTITTKLDLVLLDCPDAPALARFYAQILGWHPEGDPDADFVVIAPPEGGISPENPNGRTCLGFQQIPDFVAPTWPGGAHPQQFDLDLSCSAQIEAVEPAVLAAGATVHEHQPAENGNFKVFLDPAGHPFCLIR